MPSRHQLLVHPRTAVAVLELLAMNLMHFGHQLTLADRPGAFWTLLPGVIPAPRDVECLAQHAHRPGVLMGLNELVSHGFSFAKNAVAFFKMSRSIRNRRFSSRSRAHSSGSVSFLF